MTLPRLLRGRRLVAVLVLAVALVALATVLVVRGGGDHGRSATTPSNPPTAIEGSATDPADSSTSAFGAPGSAPTGPSTTGLGGAGGRTISTRRADETEVRLRAPVRCPASGEPSTGAFPGPDDRNGYRWVVVGTLAGRCDLESRPFHLANADTRLVWRSDAPDLAIFLLDPAEPASVSAFAQTTCSGPCAGSMVLLDKDVDSFLRVQAGDGPWSVRVEQYRRG